MTLKYLRGSEIQIYCTQTDLGGIEKRKKWGQKFRTESVLYQARTVPILLILFSFFSFFFQLITRGIAQIVFLIPLRRIHVQVITFTHRWMFEPHDLEPHLAQPQSGELEYRGDKTQL